MFSRLSTILSLALFLTTAFSFPIFQISNRASTCSANTDKLVTGINKNIDLQKQEQSQLKVVKRLADAGGVDQAKFNAAQSKFVEIVNAGITQRKANQEFASGTGAADGLATMDEWVAKAQSAELKAAKGFTRKASTDGSTFETLSTMFSGGIAQNQKNAKAAANEYTHGSTSSTKDKPDTKDTPNKDTKDSKKGKVAADDN